jgi:flagellar basal-body rod protein FlgG
MFKALNTSATGMQAQQTNMDVISNNIANVNTHGFKKSRAEFEDLLYHTIKEPGVQSGLNAVAPSGVQTGLGVRTAAVQKNFEMGSSKVTNGALDLMIEGPGFFPIQLEDGQIAFTRDGAFQKDPNGRIVDRNGKALVPEIVIPPNAAGVQIDPNGQVSIITNGQQNPQVIGQIQIVNFVNPAGLKSLGKNLYAPSPSSGQPVQGNPGTNGMGQIAQGQIESSNVNIVDEMINMISAQRSYELNSKAVQAADQMLQSLNNLR